MNNKLAKNYIIFFFATFLSGVAGLAASVFYNRIFSPSTFGKYVSVSATYSVLFLSLCGWIISSFFRYYLEYKASNRQEQLFNSIFSLLSLINLALLALLFSIYKWVFSSEVVFLVFVYSFNILPKCLVDLFTTKFKLEDWMKGYFLVTVISSFGNLAVSVFYIIVAGLGIVSLILAPITVNGLILLFFFLKYRAYFRFDYNSAVLKDFWQYGGPLIVTGLINVALAISDRYIIRYFFTDREVGIYGFSYDMSEKFFKVFVNVFGLTIQTYLMQVWQNQRENYNAAVKTFTRYYYTAFIPLVFAVQIVLDFAFNNVFNREYIEGRNLTLIVLAAMFFEGLIYIANRGFAVNKKTQYLRNIAFAAITVNIVLNIVFMPIFGYIVAAVTTLIAYAVYIWLIYVYSLKKINWKWEFYDKTIFISGLYWVAAYVLIRLTGGYVIQFALLAAVSVFYLFLLPGDIKQLLNSYKDGLLSRFKAIK